MIKWISFFSLVLLPFFLRAQTSQDLAALSRLDSLADVQSKNNQQEKALDTRLKALVLARKINVDSLLSYHLLWTGSLYDDLGRYADALELSLEAHKLALSCYPDSHPQQAQISNNLGVIYDNMGLYPQARQHYEEALARRRKLFGPRSAEYASTLNNLAIVYRNLNQWALSESFQLEVLSIRQERFGAEAINCSETHMNLGNLYASWAPMRHKAEAHYKQALKILAKHHGSEHPSYLRVSHNLASLYLDLNRLEEAQKLYDLVLPARKKLYGATHPAYAQSLHDFGLLKMLQGEYAQAQTLFQESFIVLKNNSKGSYHQAYVHLNNLSKICFYQSKREQAQDFLLQAFGSLQLPLKQLRLDLAHKKLLLEASQTQLNPILDLLETWFMLEQTSRGKTELIDLALEILKTQRQLLLSPEDQISNLRRMHTWIYLGLPLSNSFEEAFLQSERFRMVLLRERMQGQALSVEQAQIRAEIENLRLQQLNLSSRQLLKKDSLLSLQNNLKIKEKALQAQFEGLNKMDKKSEALTLDLQHVQNSLGANQALLAFSQGKEHVYVFYLDRAQRRQWTFQVSETSVARHTEKLRQALSHYEFIRENEAVAYAQFCEEARWFYRELLDSALANAPKGIGHLIILPDGGLNHLPFEVLLHEEIDARMRVPYSQLPYLIKRYQISYAFSVDTWLQGQGNLEQGAKQSAKILGMAPEYGKADGLQTATRGPLQSEWRKQLQDLPLAKEEIRLLEKQFKGHYYFGKAASEARFLEEASEFEVLHLALHGILNEENPDFSALAFSEDGQVDYDNFLQAYEIAQLQLRARLVVLSACETGFGRLDQGNGSASLARAFAYAGVPASVVSLWQVNDASTAMLMAWFYEGLAQGMDKAQALQQAKLSYLKLMENELAAHPAFWAAFVLWGDSEPLNLAQKTSTFEYFVYAFSALFVVLFFILFIKYKRRQGAALKV